MGGSWSSTEEEGPTAPVQQVVTVSDGWAYSREAGGWIQSGSIGSHPLHRVDSVDIKSAKLVRSPTSLHKHSVMLTKDPENSNQYYLSFNFDSKCGGQIYVHLDVRVDTDSDIPKFSSHVPGWPAISNYNAGSNQPYRCPKPQDLTLFGPEQWAASLQSDGFPIVVELASETEGIRHTQISYMSLKSTGIGITVSVLHQRVVYGDRVFDLEEIYGLDAQSNQNLNDPKDEGELRECVICLTDARTTAVLPCRHLCLCSSCASVVRIQNNKCPICRQHVTGLLQLQLTR